EGYGELRPDGIKTIERAAFEGIEDIEEGMSFEAQSPDGSVQEITIKKVDGDAITIDTNHPLAGVPLNFDIQVVGVRPATKEELEHGHSHDHGHSH
ncbi:MAG: hypothetical protein KC643_21440, partial [Nitrospira sp.]|nr:hypothetical protein [Nitrospira sp.]